MIGGSMTLSYQLIFDFLRHHEETNIDRPLYFDHMLATTIIGAFTGGIWAGLPKYWFTGGFLGGFLIAPMTWWLYKQGSINALHRPHNIFYESTVSQEEVDRFRQLDAIEELGATMKAQPGYGYFTKDPRHVWEQPMRQVVLII